MSVLTPAAAAICPAIASDIYQQLGYEPVVDIAELRFALP